MITFLLLHLMSLASYANGAAPSAIMISGNASINFAKVANTQCGCAAQNVKLRSGTKEDNSGNSEADKGDWHCIHSMWQVGPQLT